ncbi:hypothetical protein [Fodinibius halophilus]|uniref:Nuclear transport factor 2 family protein n=1 Tax=Fodinibius halophilus TaxID=1736908 RepID=A0A6M1T8E9_9BACT|nr:hypothetical protein [Fodinibius halophilus]NGP89725.1 hypothetical protein [Fodinibius halophilus]
MNTTFSTFILLILFFITAPLKAQDASADAVIDDLYNTISFSPDNDPDYDAFETLFTQNSRLISVGDTSSVTLTPADYKKAMLRQREEGKIIAFKEYELHRKTEQYGPILHLFSTYQAELQTPDGDTILRGINGIQMMKKDGQWKVVSLIWHEEDKAHPLPKKYLPEEK